MGLSLKAHTHLPICSRLTPFICQFPLADSSGSRILNMYDRGSLPIITELVVESADSVIGSADSTTDFTADPVKIGLWVWAFGIIC